jgi:hypothetical protein
MIRTSKIGFDIAGIAVIAGLLGATVASGAGRQPDATVTLSEGSVAAGIGWSWGHGTLPKKVQIVLTSKTKGVTLKVAAEGLKLKFEK